MAAEHVEVFPVGAFSDFSYSLYVRVFFILIHHYTSIASITEFKK